MTPELCDVDDVPTMLADVVTQIGADDMWAAGFTGAGVDVAVIDTGVAPVTELSSGNVFIGPDFSFEAPYEEVVGLDTYGHGTHMAGIIAGRTPGADPLHPRPDEFIGVLSLSYNTTSTQAADIDPLSKAVENAWNHGIVVVVSAGNEGRSAKRLANPATNPYVIAVSASKLDEEGLGIPAWAPSGDRVRNPDVLAPGDSVASLRNPGSRLDVENPKARYVNDDRLFLGSGTSQSAAVVAGSAALLLDQRPELTPDQVKGILMTSAIDLEMPEKFQGRGAIDLSAAMTTHTSPRYDQNHRPATGLGLLEEARGDDHVMRDGVPLVGEVTVTGAAWDGPAWVAASEAANSWPVDSSLSGWSWSASTWSGWSWSGWSWS